MGRIRERPADFDMMLARLKTTSALAKHYQAGWSCLARWLDRPQTRALPPPDDIAERAATMHLEALARHYGVLPNKVKRWCLIAGVTPATARASTYAIPDDFAEIAPATSQVLLAAQYGVARSVIRRWCQVVGVQTCGQGLTPRQRRLPRPTLDRMGKAWTFSQSAKPVRTIYDEAAATLQSERFIVYRADERGRADPKSELWRVGNTVLTGDELLAKAHRFERRAA